MHDRMNAERKPQLARGDTREDDYRHTLLEIAISSLLWQIRGSFGSRFGLDTPKRQLLFLYHVLAHLFVLCQLLIHLSGYLCSSDYALIHYSVLMGLGKRKELLYCVLVLRSLCYFWKELSFDGKLVSSLPSNPL